MKIAGVRWRMKRETIQQRYVIRIDAVTQFVVGSNAKPLDQDARQSAEAYIDHIVDRSPAPERPARVIAAQRTKTVLIGDRRRRDGQVTRIRSGTKTPSRSLRGAGGTLSPKTPFKTPDEKNGLPMYCANCWSVWGELRVQ
jgi:hypothetical protein